MSIYQRYGHIFWIPFFAAGRIGATHCSHCGQVLQHKQFNFALRDEYKALKSKAKTPIWTFFLLIAITLIAALIAIGAEYHKSEVAKNILNPQKGDVYKIKQSLNDQFRAVIPETPEIGSNSSTDSFAKYTLYKVDSVNQEDVYILANKYETNLITGLTDLKNDTAFETESYPITKSVLKTLFDEGKIIDIARE